ncbi:MAG: SAM-dependent methyltransferase [Actinomadura sp.]
MIHGARSGGDMTQHLPDEVKASPSGMYDYLLGGAANTPADRRSVDTLLGSLPEIRDGAEANRGFLRRAVHHLAENGIDQFVDLGSGLPTQHNTDEVAHRVNPNARVVFVDLDPLVREHVNRLEEGTVRAVCADIREPDEVLGDPAMELIDFTRPVGLLLVAVLHFVTDEYDPFAIVRSYMDALPSGSYLALSHLNGEGRPETSVRKLKEAWADTPTGIHFRTRTVVEGFYDGLEILPPYAGAAPGIVNVGAWGAEDPALEDGEGSRWAVCAVARKP